MSGPPELPPKIAASWPIQRTSDPTSSPSSVMRLKGQNSCGMIISVLLTIPIVTDCDSASGLPSASTRSPTFSDVAVPKRRHRELARLRRLQLEHRDVGQRIGADQLGRNLFARRQRADDRLGLAGDVVVGHHVPFGGDDRAAAGRLTLQLAAVLVVDGDDVDADEAGGDFREGRVDRGAVGGRRACGRLGRRRRGREKSQEQRNHPRAHPESLA